MDDEWRSGSACGRVYLPEIGISMSCPYGTRPNRDPVGPHSPGHRGYDPVCGWVDPLHTRVEIGDPHGSGVRGDTPHVSADWDPGDDPIRGRVDPGDCAVCIASEADPYGGSRRA